VSTAYAPEEWKDLFVASLLGGRAIVVLILGAVINAWVLLVEILR